MKILIVEDDNDINNLIYEKLKNEYIVERAYSGTEGKKYFENDTYNLIITDLILPGITGEELITYIRKSSHVPIIVITAKSKVDVLVDVLSMGANDYLPKPFNLKELLARINVQLRDTYTNNETVTYMDFLLDKSKFLVTYKGKTITLLHKEFDILELFLTAPDRVYTKETIYKQVWQDEYYGDENIINVHISKLRSKLKQVTGKKYIETIWSVGYRFNIK